ncbi:anti-phage ZorAB system protein ZorA [Caballeronia arvi]|uniref:anti-phage ZorAB system protein ZorA n=1 Tax=Caballeronia arvi TaxID=1777135 RepID=UPI00117C0CF7|nr:anti-phage ZorAB system protein ZorA [Caballeronia arvi]
MQISAIVKGVRHAGIGPDPDSLASLFKHEPFRHLWLEYRDTLHPLRRTANGASEIRATLPAETYFTRDVLVDSRLFDDFARHAPGILTGLGIIGTFAGLLQGLGKFDPSTPAKAVSGLSPLLGGVSHAFIASAVAIGCAIFVTFLGRLVLTFLYRRVEQLNHAIDALYNTGAGEEYLARLVHASEKSEAHAAQLKDAMVEDLSRMMTELVDRQIAAQASATAALGEQIGQTLHTSLAAPLQRMTDAMEHTSRGNGEAVSGLLESMLTGFMAKLEDTFGGQMRGVSEQIEHSLSAISAVQGSMQQLLGDIARTSTESSARVTGTLEEALKTAAANQETMTNQMREFVNEFRQLVTAEHSRTKQAMDATVGQMMTRVNETLESLADSRATSSRQEEERNAALARRTEDVIAGLSSHQELMIAQMRQFAQDFGKTAVEEQQKNQAVMDKTLDQMMTRVSGALDSLAESRTLSAQQEQARNDALSRSTHEVLSGLSGHQNTMASQVRQLAAELGAGASRQHEESARVMNGAVEKVLSDVSASMAALHSSREAAAQQDQARSDALSRSTHEVLSGLSGHQDAMAAQVRQFAAELGAGASRQHEESARVMNGAVEKVLSEVSASMAALHLSREAAAQQDQARNDAMVRRTEETIQQVTRQLAQVSEMVAAQITRAQTNINELQNVSIRAIDGMNSGAATLSAAAQRFETAGASVVTVFDRSSAVANDLQRTSAALQSASSAVNAAFQEYDRTRGAVQEYVGILSKLVESAQTETGLTSRMMSDLDRIVNTLKNVERQTTEYLTGVNEALTHSFEQFGNAMSNQLTKTIAQTDRHLGDGVQQLTGVVQELGTALQRMKRAA